MSDKRFNSIIGGALGSLIIIGYVVLLALKIENAELITLGGGSILAALGFAGVVAKKKGSGKGSGTPPLGFLMAVCLLPILVVGGCQQSPSQRYRTMRDIHNTTTRGIVRLSQISPESIPLKDLKRYGVLDTELKGLLDQAGMTLINGGDVNAETWKHIQRRLDELSRISLEAQRKSKEGPKTNGNDNTTEHREGDPDSSGGGRADRSDRQGDRQRNREGARSIHSRIEGDPIRGGRSQSEFEGRDREARGTGKTSGEREPRRS